MRKVTSIEVSRLLWAVVNCRTGKLVAAFDDCAAACLMRDTGPRSASGQTLLAVLDVPQRAPTKPRLRSRRRKPSRERLDPPDLLDLPATSCPALDAVNYFQRNT